MFDQSGRMSDRTTTTQSGQLPPRPLTKFTPLVTAAEGFPFFEKLAAEAQSHVWMAFRIFDPMTRLRAYTNLGSDWRDLLRVKLEQGVSVRVLLSDFDPLAAPDLHEGTWRSVDALNEIAGHGDLQILPVRHEARVGRGLRIGLWWAAALKLEKERRRLNTLAQAQRADAFAHTPGLWRYLAMGRRGQIRWRTARLPRLYPATLHHKVMLADGTHAAIGGLDIDERRFDDPGHQRPPEQTWHDVSVGIDGPVVADIAGHIAESWNTNRLRMAALRREQTRHAPSVAPAMPAPADALTAPDAPAETATGNTLSLVRTLSVMRRQALFNMAPRTRTRSIEEAYLDLIAKARKAIYIETQFFRSKVIAQAMAEAARRNPEVALLMILPAAPESIAFEEKSGLGERLGEHLQSECVEIVRAGFGPRAAFLSPVRPVASEDSGRAQLHGAEIVYIHSKVAIGDDDVAIVGSANLNGRSLRWDTEAGIVARGTMVPPLRQRLLTHWISDLQKGDLHLDQFIPTITRCARHNAAQPPDRRRGLLVPYDPRPARQIGVPVPGIPDQMV